MPKQIQLLISALNNYFEKMDQIIEILKISIPPLIVFAITYYMLKAFLDREKRMRAEELKI